MGYLLNFGDPEKEEEIIKKSWNEFREKLKNRVFLYNEIDKAKETGFLSVYDDLFCQNNGIKYNTIIIGELKAKMGRGAILKENENLDYNRFIPNKEFIKEDNRFSPIGKEWLYLAIGTEENIHDCAEKECRSSSGDRFGFCHFEFNSKYNNYKLIDLTISNNMFYEGINSMLNKYDKDVKKKVDLVTAEILKQKFDKKYTKEEIQEYSRLISKQIVNKELFQELYIKWGVYTYSKLLSEQIFIPMSLT